MFRVMKFEVLGPVAKQERPMVTRRPARDMIAKALPTFATL